jgi:protein TIF31
MQDVKGLYTLATAVIDYRGKRLCAQSIIPGTQFMISTKLICISGILQREQTSTVVYGSMDNGGKIAFDETFHELCCKAAKQLHIKEHTVIDSENNSIKLALPVEAKVTKNP